MSYTPLIEEYLQGAELLRRSIAGLSQAQLQAVPIPGTWSIQQVVCHIVDFEPVYADRMKRVIAEENPQILAGDPDQFAASLAYDRRKADEEIELMAAVRRQMGQILSSLPDEAFQRTGRHSRDGDLSLETLLRRITGHVPHHLKFVEEKRRALGVS
jgi:uncharacterized damage-inducible protein DinB